MLKQVWSLSVAATGVMLLGCADAAVLGPTAVSPGGPLTAKLEELRAQPARHLQMDDVGKMVTIEDSAPYLSDRE